MSNFGVTYLLKINKGRKRLSIEDNIGEELHIHFGELRLCLNSEEFASLADRALLLISEASNVSMDILKRIEPRFLFDLCRKGELPSLVLGKTETVPLKSLSCPVCDGFGLWKYKGIKHSEFLKVLKNKKRKTHFDSGQVNYLGDDNVKRCFEALKDCQNNPKICDTYPLYVTDQNIIRDGQHRAVALYYLFGGNYRVKVQRISTNGNYHVKNGIGFLQWIKTYLIGFVVKALRTIVHFPKRAILKHKDKQSAIFYKKVITKPINKAIFEHLCKNEILLDNCFFIDEDIALNLFPVIIKKQQCDFNKVKKIILNEKCRIVSGHSVEGYSFIYGLKEDKLVIDDSGNPVCFIQDKLSSQAMSVVSFMPFSPNIQNYLFSKHKPTQEIIYLLRLFKCLFDKNGFGFNKNDVSYFEKNRNVLERFETEYKWIFEDALFGYSNRMIELLKNAHTTEEYNNIISDYRRFTF